MTTFEKRSTGTTYDDRDSHSGRDSHQQSASMATAGNGMSTWTAAFYDYAEQVLKAQRQFATSMLDVARDITSPDANEDRPASNQLDARNDQRHDGANRSRKSERYNDEDTAEYNKRSADSNASDDNRSDISRTERANAQAEQSAKTPAPSAAARKRT